MQAEAIADVGDAPVAELNQVLGDLPRAGGIVDADVEDELARVLVVDEHDRGLQFLRASGR